MSATVATLYSVITDLVRLAAKYLRLGDNRSVDVLDELEEISEREGVGLDNFQVQFTTRELIKRDLRIKFPGMTTDEVVRFIVEDADQDDCQEIHLEVWKLSREAQMRVGYIGQLFAVRIKWGQFSIHLNVLAAREEYVRPEGSIATVETGDGLAYIVSQFTWGTYRIFANDEGEDITPGQKLLYIAILDRVAFAHLDIDMFAHWGATDVLNIMKTHRSGMRFNRFTAEEAGLVVIDRNYEEEALLLNSPSPRVDEERGEDLVEVERSNLEEGALGSPDTANNNGQGEKSEEKKKEGDMEFHVFDGLNRAGEKVVMTTEQMKNVLRLMMVEISPEKSGEEVDDAVRRVDWKMAVHNTNRCLVRNQGKDQGEEEKDEEGTMMGGRESWSSDEEEEEEEERSYFDVSGISSLPNLTLSSYDGLSPDGWSPMRRIRSVVGSSGHKEEPEAKRIRRLNISSGLDSSATGDYEPIMFSPMLAKPLDERNVINVSTSSSAMDTSVHQPQMGMTGNYSAQFVDDGRVTLQATEQVRGLPDEVFTGMEELGA